MERKCPDWQWNCFTPSPLKRVLSEETKKKIAASNRRRAQERRYWQGVRHLSQYGRDRYFRVDSLIEKETLFLLDEEIRALIFASKSSGHYVDEEERKLLKKKLELAREVQPDSPVWKEITTLLR